MGSGIRLMTVRSCVVCKNEFLILGDEMNIRTELFLAWKYFKPKRSAVSVITLISAIVIFRHRGNIKRIINGTENKI